MNYLGLLTIFLFEISTTSLNTNRSIKNSQYFKNFLLYANNEHSIITNDFFQDLFAGDQLKDQKVNLIKDLAKITLNIFSNKNTSLLKPIFYSTSDGECNCSAPSLKSVLASTFISRFVEFCNVSDFSYELVTNNQDGIYCGLVVETRNPAIIAL